MAAHYRKIELQSPADFTYLYANTVALSRQKLDLHLPPSATEDDAPDPMRERVRELVDEVSCPVQENTRSWLLQLREEPLNLYSPTITTAYTYTIEKPKTNTPTQYIHKTFTTASSSIIINGLESGSPQFPFPAAFTAPETVEYEAYDSELASRVSALYAQLESLTTTVAQLRREAPRKAAKDYAAQLAAAISEEEHADEDADGDVNEEEAESRMDVDAEGGKSGLDGRRRRRKGDDPAWKLQIPFGTEEETERWQSGDMADVYEDALRTLQRLQGEDDTDSDAGAEWNALATTVGKAERAERAADVVEKM